jgi:hypothetical protein
MPILRIQHTTPTYDAWKRSFDSDPVNRKDGGVRRYQVHRSVSDPTFVMIDLEFDRVDEAESFLGKLRELWDGPAKAVAQNPEAWVVETVETVDV